MRRSRALASAITVLAVGVGGCGPGAPDTEQIYLDSVRAIVPEAADVSDDTLIRMGFALCATGDGDEATQRAIEILFGEVNRFGAPESDIVGSATGAATGAFCPPSGSANSEPSPGLPSADEPVPSLPSRDELEAAIALVHDEIIAAIEADVSDMSIDGAPAQLELIDASLRGGVLEIEVAADADPSPDVVAYEVSRLLSTFEPQLEGLGPLMAALIRGAPSLQMRVVVDAGAVESVTLDAALLADLASGAATFEDWRERAIRESP